MRGLGRVRCRVGEEVERWIALAVKSLLRLQAFVSGEGSLMVLNLCCVGKRL